MITEDNKCPVCLQLFDDPRWIPCKHIYCFKCIPRLHRRDLDTKDRIVLECRICAMKHSFYDWSTVKYYATLHCVPYLTALQFDTTSTLSNQSLCSVCFNVINRDSNVDHLEYCHHCNKTICHECLIDHRMELKKNILHGINQCRVFVRKNQQNAQQAMNKLENMKIHIDFCAFELTDQIDTYSDSILAQLDEQKFYEETNSSSGYESLTEQRLSDSDYDLNQQANSQKNIILTEPSVIPIHLLGELISSDSDISIPLLNSSASRILWTMTCSFHPSHLIFEPDSSKLFICSHQGHVSVYNYTTSSLSLANTFYLQYNEKAELVIIKSLAASRYSIFVILTSSIQSILHIYSHTGLLLHSLSFINEYISQIRFDKNYLWCLELISSSVFYFSIQSDNIIDEKIRFISFEQQSFNPFRFALNQTFVAIMDRSSTGIILLYDKQTTSFLKQIKSPLTDTESCDMEITNHMLIYRFPDIILLTQLDNEQHIEKIDANKNLNITIGKSRTEVLISTLTDNHNKFIIQCYAK